MASVVETVYVKAYQMKAGLNIFYETTSYGTLEALRTND
jgi:hypothetical protein